MTSLVPRAAKVASILVISALSRPALAQQVHNPSGADALFREGRQAIKDGDMVKACALFQKSYSLDPAPGTLMNIADCEERQGHLLQALQYFNTTAESLAASDPRLSIALTRAASLDAKLPHLVLHIRGASERTNVVLEGPGGNALVPAPSWNKPVALVPGGYQVSVSDGTAWRRENVDFSDHETRELAFDMAEIRQADEAKAQKLAADNQRELAERQREAEGYSQRLRAEMLASQKQTAQNTADYQRDATRAGSWGTTLGGGIGFGLPGLLSTTVGVIGIGQIISDKHTVEQHCSVKLCDQTGFDAAGDGKAWSVVTPITLAVGGTLMTLSVYFVVKGIKQSTAVSLVTTPQGARLGVAQAF